MSSHMKVWVSISSFAHAHGRCHNASRHTTLSNWFILRIIARMWPRSNNSTSTVEIHTCVQYVNSGIALFVSMLNGWTAQGKLKRTKPFYVAQFEALKAVTLPEVCTILYIFVALSLFMMQLVGAQKFEAYDVCTWMVPPSSWRVCIRQNCLQQWWYVLSSSH